MPRDSHITVSPVDTIRSTVVFGSQGTNRPRTGARNSSTILSRGPCTPAPGTPSTIGRQVASGCSVARMASRSPLERTRKKSSTSSSCGVRALTMCVLPLLRLIDLGKRLARDAHTVDAGRYAAIHGHLQQHFANLLARHPIIERRLDVQFQLLRSIQRPDHPDLDETAGAHRQTR